MAIKWNEKLMSSGSYKIDSEHKEWILRFNDFEASIVKAKSAGAIDKSLANFAQFSNIHFPDEEALMDQYNCSAAAINRAEHQKFREKLTQTQLLDLSSGENYSQAVQLKTDMEQWLVRHICTIDIQLRPLLVIENKPPFHVDVPEIEQPAVPSENRVKPDFLGNLAQAVLQSSPDIIVVVDEDGRIVFINGRCLPLLGYEPAELIGKSVEVLVPGQFSRHKELRKKYQQNPAARSMGHRPILSALHKSGAKIPVDISLSPLPVLDGNRKLVQAVIRDALPLWTSQYELLVQSVAMNAADNGILITDTKGIIQWVNPAITRMTGYTSSELIGRTPRVLKSGEHGEAFYKNLWKTILAGETWFGEIVNRRKDGTS